MKIVDMNRLMVLYEASAAAEKKSATKSRTEPVCDVKLSSLASWLADFRNEASSQANSRTAELQRAKADIEDGTLDQDLDDAVNALIQEI